MRKVEVSSARRHFKFVFVEKKCVKLLVSVTYRAKLYVVKLGLGGASPYKTRLRLTGRKFEKLLRKVEAKMSRINSTITTNSFAGNNATSCSYQFLEYLYRIPKCTKLTFVLKALRAVFEVLQDFIKVRI